MPKGGYRPNAGRKKNPVKQLRTSAQRAARLLEELGWEEEIKELYRNCGDPRIKLQILVALQQRAWGRIEAAKPAKNEPNVSNTNSTIERLEQLLAGAVRKTPAEAESKRPN